MEQRYLLVTSDSLAELVDNLNALNIGRVVYIEKVKSTKYHAIIDTYALAVFDVKTEDIEEIQRKYENREILLKSVLFDTNTV